MSRNIIQKMNFVQKKGGAMSKPKKTMKGVTYRNGYWYARIDGHVKYCGKGDKGHKLSKTARMKWEVRMSQ